MELSTHVNAGIAIQKELALLDEQPVLLDGQRVKASACYRLSGNPPWVIYNTNCPDELMNKIEAILLKHRTNASSVDYFYSIEFSHENRHYSGRLTPEFNKGHDSISSWHVVLNEVFFGHLHKDNNHWEITEQRPAGLVEKVGSMIDNMEYEVESV